MGNIGIWELIIIAILVVIIFGGRKLPELGRGLGQGLANFRRAINDPDKKDDLEKKYDLDKDQNPAPVQEDAGGDSHTPLNADVNLDKDINQDKESPIAPPKSDQEK